MKAVWSSTHTVDPHQPPNETEVALSLPFESLPPSEKMTLILSPPLQSVWLMALSVMTVE